MPLVGAAKLVSRMGVARMGTTRMHCLALETVGLYITEPVTAFRRLWKRVAKPSSTWHRVS